MRALAQRSAQWRHISSAPRDGRWVTLGWLANDNLEYEVRARWINGRWEGDWTPTHWHR